MIMKKMLMAATVALSMSAMPAVAQEQAAGSTAANSAFGGLATTEVVVLGVAALSAVAIVSNNKGSSPTIVNPGPGPDPIPTCEDGETLVDNVCVPDNTGTVTATTTVPTTTTTVTVTATK